jgi:hypothetical protein
MIRLWQIFTSFLPAMTCRISYVWIASISMDAPLHGVSHYASYASWQSVQKEWMLRLAPPLDMKSAAENEGRDGTILHDPTLWRLRAKCSPRME